MKYCFTYVLNVNGHDFIKKIDINKYLVSINLPMLINLKSFKMKMYKDYCFKNLFYFDKAYKHIIASQINRQRYIVLSFYVAFSSNIHLNAHCKMNAIFLNDKN